VDEVLAAASAALGVLLTDSRDLGGSERSAVRRCWMAEGGTVVLKTYPDTAEGRESFAAEAAGLALTGDAGTGPRLLAASQPDRLIVMTDLGSGPSLADLLLAGSAQAVGAAVLDWANACGELAAAMAGREDELAGLHATYRSGQDPGTAVHFLQRSIGEIPDLLAGLSIPAPAGLGADLADLATMLQSAQYPVFSPGDICPDNNLVTDRHVMFVDFENAEFHSAFLDAAYLRMPFSSCWCVFRLPDNLQRSAEDAYRGLVGQIHPDLRIDEVWQSGMRRAVAAWTMHAMTYLLDKALLEDGPMIGDGRTAPTTRQLLRYRWQRLIDELEPTPAASAFPALVTLACQLLATTESWQVPDLPLYPAFRQAGPGAAERLLPRSADR
jgi:hypothetical protein